MTTKIEIEHKEFAALITEQERLRAQVTELQRDNTRLVERARASAVGGILSGKSIERAVETGDIVIDPYKREHLNPASIDLTLGDKVGMYPMASDVELDVRKESQFEVRDIGHELSARPSLVLKPGKLYLLHTAERVFTRCYVPVLDGKSSIGRAGICVHLTAGYGDPGFDGQYTLEVTTVYPIRVYVGMRFCQMRFHTLAGQVVDYRDKGNYVGEASMGPVASKVWKQFSK